MASNNPLQGGVIPAMFTPLDEREDVDRDGLRELVQHLIAGGVHGILVLGGSGEGPALTQERRSKVIEWTVEEVGGRVPVIAGVMDVSTQKVVANVRVAQSLGVDGLMVTPPFFFTSNNQAEIETHFRQVAKSTELPILLYNTLETGSIIEPETAIKLSKVDNIVALKDSRADWARLQRLLFLKEDSEFKVFQGLGSLFAASILFGADGVVSTTANVVPGLVVELYEAAKEKDLAKARQLQKRLNSVEKIYDIGTSRLGSMKMAASSLGLGSGKMSAPISSELDRRAEIEEMLTRLGLLPT